jgi:hypothetical protein
MLNDKPLDLANRLTTNQTLPARYDGWKGEHPRSIECGSDFVDHRLHVKIFGWHNADSSTGFFNLL